MSRFGSLPNTMTSSSGQLNSLANPEASKENYTSVVSREQFGSIIELARQEHEPVGKYKLAPGLDLSGVSFAGVSLYNVDFAGANLRGADLRGAEITYSDLTGCDMRDIRTDASTEILGSTLDRVNLEKTEIGFSLRTHSITYARLAGMTFAEGVWDKVDRVDMSGSDLTEVDFTGLVPRLGRVLVARGAGLIRARLAGEDLRYMDFTGASLEGADLSGADISRSNFTLANLTGANLHRASLEVANLMGADFSGADLTAANLRLSTFTATLSPDTRTKGADISGAKFEPYLAGEIPGVKQGDYAAIERHFGFVRRGDDGK